MLNIILNILQSLAEETIAEEQAGEALQSKY